MKTLILALLIGSTCFATTFPTLKVGNSSPIDPSAALEVQSTVGAFLAPRMTTTQKNAIPSAKNGDVVYDTSLNQFQGFTSGSWQGLGGGTWGAITGTLSNQTDLQNALNLKANLASPTFTGTVTAPTFVGALTGNASTATSFTGNLGGDVSGTQSATSVNKINGVSLGSLSTGILKNTTSTGVPSIAIAADFPTLNQNTSGNAATVTTNANLTGPVTSVGNATSVTNNAITNAMLAQIPSNSIKGNNTGGTANALDLTASQVNTMLGTFANPMTTAGDIIYGGASGLPTRLAGAAGVLLGSTTTPSYILPSSSGNVLHSNGLVWASTALVAADLPTGQTVSKQTAGTDGQILKSQGTVTYWSSYRDGPQAVNYIGDSNLEQTIGSWLTYNNRATVTLTSASPSVGTVTTTPYYTGMPFVFTGTTAATGTVLGTTYYMTIINSTTFHFSATVGGAFINTSSTGTALSIAPLVPITGTGGSVVGLTLTRNTTTPIRGAGDLKLVQTNATVVAGEGLTYAFTIDAADEAHALGVNFDFNASSTFVASSGQVGSDSDLEAWIYDVTNAKLIPVSPKVITANGANNFTFKGTFQSASNSLSYRFLLHSATSNKNATGWTFKGDNFYVGQQVTAQGSPINDWLSYPATSAIVGFGTPTAVNMASKRVGDSLCVQGVFTTGTPTAVLGQIPIGYNGSVGNVVIDTTRIAPATLLNSLGQSGGTSSVFYTLAPTANQSYVNFSIQDASHSANTAVNGNAGISSGYIMQIAPFCVPIVGWSSNALMSADTYGNVVSASVGLTTGYTPTANTGLIYDTVIKDTTGSYNISTGVYTAPTSGQYVISIIASSATASYYVVINGVAQTYLTTTNNITSGLAVYPLKAGDQVQIFTDSTQALGGASGVRFTNFCSIYQLQGPAAVTTTETIAAAYNIASSTTQTGGSPEIFTVKLFDTHSAYNTSTGIFTAPVSGYYDFTTNGQSTTVSATTLTIYVNGAQRGIGANDVTATARSGASFKVQLLAGDQAYISSASSVTWGDTNHSLYISRIQ